MGKLRQVMVTQQVGETMLRTKDYAPLDSVHQNTPSTTQNQTQGFQRTLGAPPEGERA